MIKNLMLLISFVFIVSLNAKDKNKIVVAGPFASVSHPLILMQKNDVLKDLGKTIEFRLWKNPDELRAIVLNSDVDFVAVPTNVAANLYNKGVNIKLLNVSIWGILGMVSRDKNLKTLADFKGKEIAMPFRSDMPDIIFEQIIKEQGMNLKEDFKIRYVSSPIDAIQMLMMRRVDHALLAEPAISMALEKTQTLPFKLLAPDLYRSSNLQKEWGEIYKIEAKIPQAGMAYIGKDNDNKKLINRFLSEYDKALTWYKQNPYKASKIVVEEIPMLEEKGLGNSIKYINMKNVNAKDSKKDLEFFFEILKTNNPKVIGGKLPSDNFYYKN